MATRSTVDLLPEIFRTPTNRKFLKATLDQFTQEPRLQRTKGYVGRRIGPGVEPQDYFIPEPDAVRADYQLEPGVVFLKPDTDSIEDLITYPGILDSLSVSGADVQRQDRLFASDYYTWDPFCDLDKFTNYSQYYWLPSGPDEVDVSQTLTPLTDTFAVTRDRNSYAFSGLPGNNPVITLVRGGNYQFTINQPGHSFWIQTAPGINGETPATPNISSRDVLGVINNGTESGTVIFNVPRSTAQDFFYGLDRVAPVDLISNFRFDQLNNIYVDTFLASNPGGIDGITNLDQLTVIFPSTVASASAGGWQITTQFDPLNTAEVGQPGSFDSLPFDQTTDITSLAERYSVWRINYVTDTDGRSFMKLSSVREVANLTKFDISFGSQYSSTTWYKNSSGYFEQVPLLTAVLDELYYQDSTNPNIFGIIRLLDPEGPQILDFDEIIGATNYTSPNGVVFTNGLKIQVRGQARPARFQEQTFYVEGVGTGPGLSKRVGFVDGEAYFGPYHEVSGQKITGEIPDGTFQQYIYDTIEQSIINKGSGTPDGAPLSMVGTVDTLPGNGIKLIPVNELVTPETYTENATTPYDSDPFSSSPFDDALNAPLVKDYITINRSSQDRNAWSRSNRWFHIDVLRYSAERNNTTLVIDNLQRAKRPIIEFRGNLKLFNSGTQAKIPVNIVDFATTDAFSNINGTTGYIVDGYTFLQDTLVIFAADLDASVRNRIYRVDFIDPDGDVNSPKIINLVPVDDGVARINQTVVALNGLTQQGKTFWFDGGSWQLAQEKTSVNQAPLFDVYDKNGRSFSDQRFYPSTTFAGSKLFGYALGGTSTVDQELGFALQYLNLNNVGDIVFTNYLYTDTFLYVLDRTGVTEFVSNGFVRQYGDRVSFGNQIGWLPAITQNLSRQIFRFSNVTGALVLDVAVSEAEIIPPVQVFVNDVFLDPAQYEVTVQGNNTFINLLQPAATDAVIEVAVLSDQSSAVAYYEVPLNLENNAFNENSPQFTLGTIRAHYESIGQNLQQIQGKIIGANNSRDLGVITRYGQNIVQHSSPLTLSGVFLREPQYEISQALQFNSVEYEKYKARLIDVVTKGNFVNLTPTEILDNAMQELSIGRDPAGPFYWSDMVPAGDTYDETQYTYNVITPPTFDLNRVYDLTSSNFFGLLIFVNGVIITRGKDYVVSQDSPTVSITKTLQQGDIVTIREYATTYGSFVPNTPTKMGLYPAFRPEIYQDLSYVTPRTVIRGHDGSITLAYGDDRDQVLLEFETRIYNNLKIADGVPLTLADVVPGQWRVTDYSLAEINSILSSDFLSWVGWNKLDYTTQDYVSSNAFTFNWSQSSNKNNGEPLLGAWRGIYQNFYDTIAPNTRPWEMLGFSEEPSWWQGRYGPPPYTSGNLVLWNDLANGLVRDPLGAYVLPQYRRPELLDNIPSGSEGALLPPIDTVVGNTDATSYARSWTFGDGGPVEATWRSSSSYPFAVMRLFALTQPAKFFSLFVDRDRYRLDQNLGQYLWDGRYRLDAKLLSPLYGSGVSRASYVNWIIDYNRQLGLNSTSALETRLSNLDIRLSWRTGAFTDKRFLKIFTKRSSPGGQNTSLLLPDESYNIMLYKNQPSAQFQYSSVIVQRVEDGYAVLGYSPTQPYFDIVVSLPLGGFRTLTVNNIQVNVPIQYTDRVAKVPYGYVFRNRAAVCDFLLSYGNLLQKQGMVFDDNENGYIMDWLQMAQEFLYWSGQGWQIGSMINLNPAANRISITRPNTVAESLFPMRADNIILNQNRQAIPAENLIINRFDNTLELEIVGGNATINYFGLRFTAYEHVVVLDNRSIFNDLIYDPTTGSRQSNVLATGALTLDWNGTVNAPGFVLNQDNIRDWQPNLSYTKGDIVRFKNELWTASTIIESSQEFNYTLWIRSDYDEIQRGLLPNAATASDQLANAYSVYNANLEREIDLFSYGLIGFRPRQYMSDLNLDDISQVNLYQQFIGTKGTENSLEVFSLADLGKETAEYNIYEYWAIRRALYGATANRNFFEVVLDSSALTSNPSTIEIIEPGQSSQANQTVLTSNIWQSSFPVTNPDILPTLVDTVNDSALPSAGYVNFDDVDYAVYDLDALTTTNTQEFDVGDIVWTAADGLYDWNVYRAVRLPATVTSVTDNFADRSIVNFSAPHGLSINDVIVIRYFDIDIDGAYRVISVPSLSSIIIDFEFTGFQTTETGTGVAIRLDSARVGQASDVINVPDVNTLIDGSLIWVDRYIDNKWAVLKKQQPYNESENLQVQFPESDSEFGAAISQGFLNNSALVGAPSYNSDGDLFAPGAVYSFVKNDQDQYQYNGLISLGTTGIAGFGNAIDIGNQRFSIIGASKSNGSQGYAVTIFNPAASNLFTARQILNAGDLEFGATEFGYAVTMSRDENWIGIGAPGDESSQVGGAFYVYAQETVQEQSVEYVTDGVATVYNWSDHLKVTNFAAPYWQFTVVLDNELLTPGVDYSIDANNIILSQVPLATLSLLITRRQNVQLDQQTYRNVVQSSTTGTGTGAKFTVTRTRGVYSVELTDRGSGYNALDTLTISAASIGGGSSPANDLVITVTVEDGGAILDYTSSGSGVSNTADFNLNLYFAQVSNIWAFSVTVNGVLQRPEQDYEYRSDGWIEFSVIPPAGAVINVRAVDHYRFVEKIIVPGLSAGARFGHSITTTTNGDTWIVGAPNHDTGTSFVYNRSSETFQVNESGPQIFTTQQSLIAPTKVKVNGQFIEDEYLNFGGEYLVLSSTTVQISKDLQVGDLVEIYTNHWTLSQQIDSQAPAQNSLFGSVVDQCINDCSLYISAPQDSTLTLQNGAVELWQNQAGLYGTITSDIANPVLTIGDTLSINGFLVSCTGTSVVQLATDIQNANIPNATAQLTSDLEFITDGVTKVFDVGDIYSATTFSGTPNTLVTLDSVVQTANVDYTYNNSAQTITFTNTPVGGQVIKVISGRLILTAINIDVAPEFKKLAVARGTGTLWQDLGLTPYVYQQKIVSPTPQNYANFGSSIFISDDTLTLAVGAPGASAVENTTFDNATTLFDAKSTDFIDLVTQSGAVYTYDFLPAYQASATNPGQFVFGQQLRPANAQPYDRFGTSVDITSGILLAGAPGADIGDSQANYGSVFQFINSDNSPSWQILRQEPSAVDINLLNTLYVYDYTSNVPNTYLDYFDPLQGRLLGAVSENIDYISAVDPANYNVGPVNNRGNLWAQTFVGKIWWDTTNVRFVDANQGDALYASRRWGQVFPGSQIEIYEWVSSTNAPDQYNGPGLVRDTQSYVLVPTINDQGIFQDTYYFWVTDNDQVADKKTLSTNTLSQYIENPRGSGLAYLAPLQSNLLALYNCAQPIAAGNAILHVEFDRVPNDDVIHQEYQLIAKGRPQSFLDLPLYNKMIDSFCGVNVTGQPVPDPVLSAGARYGVSVRPRQTMFVDRFAALKNYLTAANTAMALYPIAEIRKSRLLDSAEPEPTSASGTWNMRVANDQELSFQDLALVPLGYRYLVASDATNQGRWTIYQVISGDTFGSKTLRLLRVQNYDTRLYWNYVDWYRIGFDPLSRVLQEVPNYASLSSLSVPDGSIVKVTANAAGKWEIYQLTDSQWLRVGLESGTVVFDPVLWDYSVDRLGFDAEVFDTQYFDQEPVIETRKILQAINQEIFIGELLIERNRLLTLMFDFILSEQLSPDWLYMTSLIDVDHVIRQLEPFQIYRRDNQEFVLDYINEVKPYRTQIREFGLIYEGLDTYQGSVTDFDVPAAWNNTKQTFVSPVLDNTGTMSTTSSTASTDPIWQEFPWSQWFQNYLLSIQSVEVVEGGSGYTVAPQVEITGTAQIPATLQAVINSAGQVVSVLVINAGKGYSVSANITFTGGNGSGARAVAIMGNQMVRGITTTLRYDRYQYGSEIAPWQPNVLYLEGDRVRYLDRVWQVNPTDSAGVESTSFDPDQWTVIPAGELTAADRVKGYYTPDLDQPGIDLAQLISGIEYPGVQVSGVGFDYDAGFGAGPFDVFPFDNLVYGPEGVLTFDPQVLDAIYESEFTDPYLGVLPAPAYDGDPPNTGPNPIVVSGGAFIDTYSSHAPPELIPGSSFDTLDFKVYTTPGSDWFNQGNGFPIAVKRYSFVASQPTLDFGNVLELAVSITVFNITTGIMLYPTTNYDVDWVAQTVTVTAGASTGDVLEVSLASLGGGNQIFEKAYVGSAIGSFLIIPVQYAIITELVIFVNGSHYTTFTSSASGLWDTRIDFASPLTSSDAVVVTALGETEVTELSWSTPVTQYIVADGSASYTLTNSMSGTNPSDIIVTVDGLRARPSNSVAYISDGSTLTYDLPSVSDVDPALIADNDVSVYVGGQPLILGIGFLVDAYDGSTDRTVTLTSAPANGSYIQISVRTNAQYRVSGDQWIPLPLEGLNPAPGSIIAVTSFNDTTEQRILTQVYVGPDVSTGTPYNRFAVDRPITDTDRLIVTLQGNFLFVGYDFELQGTDIVIFGDPIASDAVVTITSFTMRTVPEAMAFRVFQDMRGLQRIYSINAATTTTLSQSLSSTDDVIHVVDASKLEEPNLPQGYFGVVTIDGERIAYRVRDTINNQLSGLRRGTAGTGAASHTVGAEVITMGSGNLLPAYYQRQIISADFLADGIDTDFEATDIVLDDLDSTELVEAVQVFVAGRLQQTGYSVAATAPVRIEFETAPAAGLEVSIQVQQGRVLYTQGIGTASNGVPLQISDSTAARFIRGE